MQIQKRASWSWEQKDLLQSVFSTSNWVTGWIMSTRVMEEACPHTEVSHQRGIIPWEGNSPLQLHRNVSCSHSYWNIWGSHMALMEGSCFNADHLSAIMKMKNSTHSINKGSRLSQREERKEQSSASWTGLVVAEDQPFYWNHVRRQRWVQNLKPECWPVRRPSTFELHAVIFFTSSSHTYSPSSWWSSCINFTWTNSPSTPGAQTCMQSDKLCFALITLQLRC